MWGLEVGWNYHISVWVVWSVQPTEKMTDAGRWLMWDRTGTGTRSSPPKHPWSSIWCIILVYLGIFYPSQEDLLVHFSIWWYGWGCFDVVFFAGRNRNKLAVAIVLILLDKIIIFFLFFLLSINRNEGRAGAADDRHKEVCEQSALQVKKYVANTLPSLG